MSECLMDKIVEKLSKFQVFFSKVGERRSAVVASSSCSPASAHGDSLKAIAGS